MTLERWVLLAGVGQLILATASLAVPHVLGWRSETAVLRPLTRQVFWTYAAYILGSHVAFGLVSVLAAGRLVDGSPLATAVTGFIAVWWVARIAIQFAVFDRRELPGGTLGRSAEAALVALFVFLALVYGAACLRGMR